MKIIAKLVLNQGRYTFVTSDFPAENPRTQNRNYSYTNTLVSISRTNQEKYTTIRDLFYS